VTAVVAWVVVGACVAVLVVWLVRERLDFIRYELEGIRAWLEARR
jgi:hypothetical protein